MFVEFKSLYGILKHNELTEVVAEILMCFKNNNQVILFCFYERNKHFLDDETLQFISKRQTFINSNWVLPWNETIPHWDELNNTPPNIIWYQANNKEEIIKAIEIDNLFRCVVINKNGKFEDCSNVIFHQEYYATIDEEEDYEYCIGFTNKEHFLENTLSKIKSSVSTKIYVEKN